MHVSHITASACGVAYKSEFYKFASIKPSKSLNFQL